MIYKPHNYQELAGTHILSTCRAGLLLDMGLGKTIISLTAVETLLNSIDILKPLIVAPKRVAEHTWITELNKWDHLKGLRMSRIIGSEKQRIQALMTPADIYIVSRDNIAWLVDYSSRVLKKWSFDMLIIDELSSFKNRGSMRFKAVRKIVPHLRRVVGLTGTPAPNSLLDLWPQLYLLDQGERLGRTYTSYQDTYFTPGARNGHVVYKYALKDGADKIIHEKIGDICLSMTAKDYLDVPDRIDINEEVQLKSMERYQEFKKTEVLELESGEEISPVNAAAMYSQLLQYCNGAVYLPDKSYEIVDDTKMEALLEAVEVLNGNPVIIFYSFVSDKERILAKLPHAKALSSAQEIDDWNAGKIEVLLLHPASAGHGLNLQGGGNTMFWYGLPWSLELYQQSVARLHRQGQSKPVINKHFITEGTVEQIVADRLTQKGITQDELIAALKRHLY